MHDRNRSRRRRLVAALAVGALVAATLIASPRHAADGPRSDRYREGQRALSEERWSDALDHFSGVAASRGGETDAALYWQAWSESKLGRRVEALATLRKLAADHPKSEWVDDARALELELSGKKGAARVEAGDDEDLKLYALDSLMQAEPERAVPILERFLAGSHSLRLKERALFVLGQSDTPRAREILVDTARRGTPPELRLKAIESLGIAGDAGDVAALGAIWKDATPAVQQKILEAWMIAGAEAPVLDIARGAADPAMRRKAIEMLGVMGASRALGELYASEKDPAVRAKLLEAYGLAGDVDAVLRAAKGESDRALRAKAIETLGVFGEEAGARHLVELYRVEQDRSLRRKIAESLMVNGDARALIELFRQETDPELKRTLVQQLSMIDDEAAQAFFAEILGETP